MLLKDINQSISCDSSLAVYAEKINGQFQLNSECRFGQRVFENGGVLDDCELFMVNDAIVHELLLYADNDEEWLEENLDEAIQAVIDLRNENTNYPL